MRTHLATALVLLAACTTKSDVPNTPAPIERTAIFTTTVDGSISQAYAGTAQVYLDSGPGAASGITGLSAGDYYFQVTDASGKRVLSADDISCRRVRVNVDGFIDHVYPGLDGCQHGTGMDAGYALAGAITVRLSPFHVSGDSRFKVWMTPVDKYSATHGFERASSKTKHFCAGTCGGGGGGDDTDSDSDGDSDSDHDDKDSDSDGDSDSDTDGDHDDDSDGDTDSDSEGGHDDGDSDSEGDSDSDGGHDDGDTDSDSDSDSEGGGHDDDSDSDSDSEGDSDSDSDSEDGDSDSDTDGDGDGGGGSVCCGNGHVDAGEECDDDNTTSGDGCSSTCEIEAPVCGDGHVDAGEECDDGNTTGGDGCSSGCQHECPTTCGGCPQTCH